MRTQETQEKNLRIARGYACYDVSQAIHASHYSKADKETMLHIINATYNEDALERYQEADTMVREALQDIIEKTYYGSSRSLCAEHDGKPGKIEHQPKVDADPSAGRGERTEQ